MGVFGPYTAAAGVVQQCPVDPDAQAVYIRNSSIYDLYVAASPIAPPATSAFGGWPWVARIPQGDRAGIRLPLERYAGAGFPGYIWVLPQTATTGFALSGTSSSNASFTVEGYPSQDDMPPGYASPQFQNVSSQPRMLAIPMSLPRFYQGLFASGATNTENFLGPAPNLSAANIANGFVTVYLYHMLLSPVEAVTANGCDIVFRVHFNNGLNGSGTNIGTAFDFARVALTQGTGGIAPSVQFSPPWPYGIVLTVPATALSVRGTLVTAAASASISYDFCVAFNIDGVNTVQIADIGNSTLLPAPQGFF